MDAVTAPPAPSNEPVRSYPPGSPERASLEARVKELAGDRVELTSTIGGRQRMAGGERIDVVQPHRHSAVLGTTANATTTDAQEAVDAALAAGPAWRELPFDERAAVLLRAAELLAGPWRDTLNAATMLGQSKSCYQAEIDAACELIDFLRFNVHFGRRILEEQPLSSPGVWNRMDHRPLEGFVVAITPFNFTAIAGNLPLAPALMGNTVVWKPSPTQQLAAHHTMRLLEAAGLPPGVINLVTGDGQAVSEVALTHRAAGRRPLHRLHRDLPAPLVDASAATSTTTRGYPRLVGETGGKDFVIAHPSADPAGLVTGLVRGAFEYQGQKCSAASRAYVPRSPVGGRRPRPAACRRPSRSSYGDVTDLSEFGGAVIDRRAFDRLAAVLEPPRARPVDRGARRRHGRRLRGLLRAAHRGDEHRPDARDLHDGVLRADPRRPRLRRRRLGRDARPGRRRRAVRADRLGLRAPTGPRSVEADRALRFSAGNFYVNDKPTGAVVGQQPFGGARASGTNDKAGSILNLLRWVSPRTIKETFSPPTDHRYPHQG